MSEAFKALGKGQLWAQSSPTVGANPANSWLGAPMRSSGGWLAPPGDTPLVPLPRSPTLDGPSLAAGQAQGALPTAQAAPEGAAPSQGTIPGASQSASPLGPPQPWATGPEGVGASKTRMLELYGPTPSPAAEAADTPSRHRTARCDGPGPRGRAGVRGGSIRETAAGEGTPGAPAPDAPPPATCTLP